MNLPPKAAPISGQVEPVALIAHLPAGAIRIPFEQVIEYSPQMLAVSYRPEAGLVHVLNGCPIELVLRESSIFRAA
jgi:hypothetical protein